MRADKIMSEECVTCTPDTLLQEVSELMLKNDCGCLPVVESQSKKRPVGVITDRDIVCRVVAKGKNPLTMKVSDCMSRDVATLPITSSSDECCEIMEQKMIRRVIVIDEHGECCGIIAQADIARKVPNKTEEVLKQISNPNGASSYVANV